MIEFGLKHSHSSGWKKKFPRKKINELDPTHLSIHGHFKLGYDRNYGKGYLSRADLIKFLKANIGKNIDKVFSVYIKRAKNFKHYRNLKEVFFNMFKESRYRLYFGIDKQNRIIKLEKSESYSNRENVLEWNKNHYPESVISYLNETTYNYLGKFYIRTYSGYELVPIYIVYKEWLDVVKEMSVGKSYIRATNFIRTAIPFKKYEAKGIPKNGVFWMDIPTGKYVETEIGDFEKYERIPFPFSTYRNEPWIFITPYNERIQYCEV